MIKYSLLTLLSLSSIILANPPEPGNISEDVTYSLAGDTVVNRDFTELTNSQLSDLEGKVILIAYYTPW